MSIEEEAQHASQALWRAIGMRARAHCREAGTNPEQMQRLRKAAWQACSEIRTLSTFLAARYGVPPEVLFCVIIESIGEWCRSEDFELATKDANLN